MMGVQNRVLAEAAGVADTDGFINTHPLCLRYGCSRCEFLQSTKWKKDGMIYKETINSEATDCLEASIYLV